MKSILSILVLLFTFSANAQWTDIPSVNTHVSSLYSTMPTSGLAEETCQSVSDGNGGIIIVWWGLHTSGSAIFAQRLDASGYRMWGEGIVVNDAADAQLYPVLVSDGNSGAIIAWQDYRSSTNVHIYAQRLDSDGNLLWQTNGVPVCTTASDKFYLQIASDNNSGAYIAWLDYNAGYTDSDIYAQRLDQDGNLIGPPAGILICTAPYFQVDPSIITADAQGNAIISWFDFRQNFSAPQIYAQKINITGDPLWAPNGIPVTDILRYQVNNDHSICSDGNGGAILTWEDYRYDLSITDLDIYAQRVDNNGNVMWIPQPNEQGVSVCNAINDQDGQVITSDGMGGAIIAWADQRSGSSFSVYTQKINQSGSTAWTPQGVLICDGTYSAFDGIQIAPASSGGAIICWSDNRDFSTNVEDVYAQRIDQFGSTRWDYSGNVISNNTLEQVFPKIINDGSDNAIIIWPDGRLGIYAQRILKDGLFVSRHRVDGFISNSEYGSHIDGENQQYSNGITWYMDWTGDSLYVAIQGYIDPSLIPVIYMDIHDDIPVNNPDPLFGNLSGTGNDGITPSLPFAADFYCRVQNNYDVFMYSDGTGGWYNNVIPSPNKSYNAINAVLEFAIAWSDINPNFNVNGGYFNWLGYFANVTNTACEVPVLNLSTDTAPEFTWYYTVRFTGGLGIPAFPFANISYTHIGNSIPNFGSLNCYDFTFNTPSALITRTSGAWLIGGRMVVADGTLNFNNITPIDIYQNYVQLGGDVNFNSAYVNVGLNCLKYGGNINLNPGQTFTLDGFSGGILEGPFPFQNLTINKSQIFGEQNVNAWSDQIVNGTLTLLNGNLIMQGPPPINTPYTLTIGPNGSIVSVNGYIQGRMSVNLPPSPAPNGSDSPDNLVVNLPIGTANGPSPVSIDFGSITSGGFITVQAIENVHPNAVSPTESMKRYWKINKDNNLAFTSANITFSYLPQDFNTAFFEATDEAAMVVGKYDASNWLFPNISSRAPGGGNDGGTITVSGITSFSDFTIAKNPSALPVELESFTAKAMGTTILLNWQTKTEVNNYGFNVERSINEGDWNNLGFVEGHGNSNSPKEYSYTDKELFAGGSKFQYRLKQIDTDGQFEYSDVVEVEIVPDQYELSQNYPNPFNPSTKIQFSLPKETQLKINIYNMLGEQVATIAEGMYESGYHKVTFDASNLPSGTYIYRLESSDFVQVKKMILLK